MMELYVKMMIWLQEKQEGQDLIEYALLAGLIAIVAVVAIIAAGTKVSQLWSSVASALGLVTAL